MRKQTILIIAASAAVLALVLIAIKTRPSGTALTQTTPSLKIGSPLSEPLLVEMMEDDGIKAGPTTNADLAVIAQNNQIRVVLSSNLQKRLGADCLVRLGMLLPDETMSPERYRGFLKSLHDIIVESEAQGEHHHSDDETHHEAATHR
jgi:hypothetical protein